MIIVNGFAGLTQGAFFAIIGILLTLMSQLTRVVNFSQLAVGMFGGFVGMTLMMRPGGNSLREHVHVRTELTQDETALPAQQVRDDAHP